MVGHDMKGYDEVISIIKGDIVALYSSERNQTDVIKVKGHECYCMQKIPGKPKSVLFHAGNLIIDEKVYNSNGECMQVFEHKVEALGEVNDWLLAISEVR